MINMTEYEYKFLTNKWEGIKGAAYTQVFEFCREFGWIDEYGILTKKGLEKILDYEECERIKNGV